MKPDANAHPDRVGTGNAMRRQTKLERWVYGMTLGRSCGECRECCIVPKIEEFDKPARSPCRHLCTAGCGIYADRPTVCSNFQCWWLEGQFKEEHRPDKSGIIVHGSSDATRAQIPFPHALVNSRFSEQELERSRSWQEIRSWLEAHGQAVVLDAAGLNPGECVVFRPKTVRQR